jgi:hypothetical protein
VVVLKENKEKLSGTSIEYPEPKNKEKPLGAKPIKQTNEQIINSLLNPNDFSFKRFGLDKKIEKIRKELVERLT